MRDYDAPTLSALNARKGIIAHRLVSIEARAIPSGTIERLDLWTGDFNLSIVLDGTARTYLALGAVLQGESIVSGSGLEVRVHQLRLSAIPSQVEDLVKGYDTRFAPVSIHRALFDPITRNLVGTPHRVFKGVINSLDFPTVPAGEEPACVVEVVSEARILTRTLPLKKSNDSQRRRAVDDGFRKYGDISGSVPVYWGERKIPPPPAPSSAVARAPQPFYFIR